MRGELSPPSPTPSSPVGGEVGDRSARRIRSAWTACREFPRSPKPAAQIRMIEDVEELPVDAQLHALGQLEPLGEVQIAPDEIGTAQRVAAEIAELAVLRTVAARARARARIDRRNERIRIQPLDGSRLRDAGNRIVFVQRHARNHAGDTADRCLARCRFRWPNRARSEPRTAGRCARTPCRTPAIRSARAPAARSAELDRQLINILRREVVPHVVIARAVLRGQARPAAAKECAPAANGRNPPFETVSMQWLQV